MTAFGLSGTTTTNGYFYLPGYGAYGLTELAEYNTYMQTADTQIEANKDAVAAIISTSLPLYYLKTEIDTLGEVETIYSKDIVDTTEMATYCETTEDYLKTSEEIDWTVDQEAVDIHAGNYTDTNTIYTGDTEIVVTGAVLSIGSDIARDSELHAQNTDTDLDATFEATFAKKADKLSVLAATTSSELAGVISDETGSGALVFGTSPTITTPVIKHNVIVKTTTATLNVAESGLVIVTAASGYTILLPTAVGNSGII